MSASSSSSSSSHTSPHTLSIAERCVVLLHETKPVSPIKRPKPSVIDIASSTSTFDPINWSTFRTSAPPVMQSTTSASSTSSAASSRSEVLWRTMDPEGDWVPLESSLQLLLEQGFRHHTPMLDVPSVPKISVNMTMYTRVSPHVIHFQGSDRLFQRSTKSKRRLEETPLKASSLECVLCMESLRSCVLFPCRHLGTCAECVKDASHCPACRGEIKSKEVIFFV